MNTKYRYISFIFFALFMIEFLFSQTIKIEERFRETYQEPIKEEIIADDYLSFNAFNIDSFIVAKMNQYHIPGLAASIVKDGGIYWTGAYGFADIENNIEVTDSTLFMLASISKTVTGVALMQLWENGFFGLDDNINNYLPFEVHNPFYPDSIITFRMLLTHTSSINDNWDEMPYYIGDSPVPLGSYLEDYLVPGGAYYHYFNYNNFAPGTQWDYCNIGATLAGYLVEVLTSNFSTYTHDSIFIPLEMNETAWFLAELDTTHIARPYYYSGGNYHAYAHYGYSDYPAGQLRTSTLQLSKFLAAFMQGGEINGTRILDSSTVALMTTVQFPQIMSQQGLIWYNQMVGGRYLWGHKGGGSGVGTVMFYSPSENIGVIFLSNGGPSDVWQAIVDALFDYAIPVSVDNEKTSLVSYRLYQNYPNPFNPSTTFSWQSPVGSHQTIKLFDLLGKEVETIVDGYYEAGNHSTLYIVNSSLPSGVYFYQLKAGDFIQTKKMILIK